MKFTQIEFHMEQKYKKAFHASLFALCATDVKVTVIILLCLTNGALSHEDVWEIECKDV
jgi:hypothetical protein